MTAPPPVPPTLRPPPIRLSPEIVTPPLAQALRLGAVVVRADVALLALTGPGAVTCCQGLLTNDIEKPGDGAFVYGALLTPKGMIVVDGWATRLGATVGFAVPRLGADRARDLFTRSIPPRLARVEDRSADAVLLRVAGARALGIAQAAGIPVPGAPGRAAAGSVAGAACEVARASEGAGFALQITAAPAAATAITAALVAAGALEGSVGALELSRVLAGWPALDAEVDEKTIPQEVRYDEIGGVSYTKGCYTGQETVSRLHFRGHTNRYLAGLEFAAEPPPEAPAAVLQADKEVGRVTSVAWVPELAGGGRWIALAMVRREVVAGETVRAAGREARVVALPFAAEGVAPA